MDKFLFQILEPCPIEKLIEREQFHIDTQGFNSLYNARPTADSCVGVRRTPEMRAHLSKLARKRWADPAHRKRFLEAQCSDDARAKMREAGRKRWVAARGASGLKGVARERKKWLAYVQAGAKRRRIGTYATPELAYTWRLAYIAQMEWGHEQRKCR